MKKSEVLVAWTRILAGRAPSLSIEITKECPLRCPGCHAFDEAHLRGTTQLRQLSDFKCDELVMRVLALVDEHKPLHVAGSRVTVHCAITSQIADRRGYLNEFLAFWTERPEIAKVWFSLFTPQRGASDVEILTSAQRNTVVAE